MSELDLDVLEAAARKAVMASPEHLGVFALIAEVRRLKQLCENRAEHARCQRELIAEQCDAEPPDQG